MSPRAEKLQAAAARAGRAALRVRAELLTAAALLGGWAFLTWGIARRTAPDAWIFSAGLLLFSLGGWRLLWTIIREGLYKLTRHGGDG